MQFFGLQNQESSCFANSALQALLSHNQFDSLILPHQDFPLLDEQIKLIEHLSEIKWAPNSNAREEARKQLLEHVRAHTGDFAAGQQHDAAQFLEHILINLPSYSKLTWKFQIKSWCDICGFQTRPDPMLFIRVQPSPSLRSSIEQFSGQQIPCVCGNPTIGHHLLEQGPQNEAPKIR